MPSSQFGLSNSGFNPMRLADCLQFLTQQLQSTLGPNIDLSSDTPLGQIVGIIANLASQSWQGQEALYQMFNPDTATGINQDDLYAINNVLRDPATYSLLSAENVIPNPATITGTPGTVIQGTDNYPSSAFSASVTTSNHQIVFEVETTVTIPSGGSINVNMKCTQTGPFAAPEGTLTVIETPTTGIASITNSLDAFIGANEETDSAFQARRLNELQISNASTLNGILDTLAQTAGLTQPGVVENDLAVSAGGLPPNSINGFVASGTGLAIATALFKSKAAGIQAFGNSFQQVVDSQGNSHTIGYSTPQLVTLYFIVNITKTTNPADGPSYPSGGDAAVAAALVAYGQNAKLGQDANNIQFVQAVMNAVSGIKDMTILQGTIPNPVGSADISFLSSQIMNIQTNNIVVNS